MGPENGAAAAEIKREHLEGKRKGGEEREREGIQIRPRREEMKRLLGAKRGAVELLGGVKEEELDLIRKAT